MLLFVGCGKIYPGMVRLGQVRYGGVRYGPVRRGLVRIHIQRTQGQGLFALGFLTFDYLFDVDASITL